MKLQERDHVAHQDHGGARHRRAPPAAGRPHQAEARRAARRWTSASRCCRRCSARRSCMRLLDKSNLQLDMTKLGFEQSQLDVTSRRRSTSPTAWCSSPAPPARARRPRSTRRSPSSTRSTTNISTAEDPVEFNLAGINQVQMHEDIGLNFAAALRALPAPGPRHHHGRRDPRLRDGRDRASRPRSPATWCSRRCTPTTRPSTVTRLLNMGIEPFLVTASVNLHPGPAPRAPRLRRAARSRRRGERGGARSTPACRPSRSRSRSRCTGARLPRPATTPATRAASRSTR